MNSLTLINQFAVSGVIGLSLTAAVTDVRDYRIPNWLTAGLLVLYPVHVLTSPETVSWGWSLAIASGVLIAGIILFAMGSMGGGDVKLLTAISLWAGPDWIIDFLFLTAIVGGVMAIVMMTRLKTMFALACESIGRTTWRDKFLAEVLPYGVAIAFGGTYVGIRLITAAA